MVQAISDVGRRSPRVPRASRVPPHNLEAEESLLGAMLLSKDAIASAVETCGGDDFYKPAHGHVFEAITSLYGNGEPADPVTVADELRRAGLLEAVGGSATLVTLQANTPATSNAGRYARIVEEHALLRRLIGVAGEIAELGYDVPDDVAATVDRAESLVFEVAQRRVVDTLAPIRELLEKSLDRLEALFDRGQTITGVPTGYADLDEQLAGLQPANLVIVGARPAAGKTSFALGMASHAAIEGRVPVLLFSLEMSHLEITQRLLCAEARVDATRMRNGRLLEADWPKISHAIGRLGEAPIFVDDNPNLTVMDIRAKARRLKSRERLGLVVVDYLQLMSGRSNAENRQVEVSEISRGLKILARELNVPVVALSQLSRNLEMRSDKRPVLADLRESGCLTPDTRVLRADTGAEVTLGGLLVTGERDVPVWSVDPDLRLVKRTMTHVFHSGTKPVFELRMASGRRVKASANHPFRAATGWVRLDELKVGDRLAVSRPAPGPVWSRRRPQAAMAKRRLRGRRVAPGHWAGGLGSATSADSAGGVYPPFPGRARLAAVAELADDERLRRLARSDVFWDPIVGIDPLGDQRVYDATVPGTHNFIANGIVVHNSLEQDADVVLFIYRDELYNTDSPDRGTAEIIVSKHRNGPTGICRLAFLDHYTRFANMARV
jgi:replicative DNA helicase